MQRSLSGNGAGHRPLLVHHVSKRWQVPARTVRHWPKTGRLRGFHEAATPKLWRFHYEDVESFMRALEGR